MESFARKKAYFLLASVVEEGISQDLEPMPMFLMNSVDVFSQPLGIFLTLVSSVTYQAPVSIKKS